MHSRTLRVRLILETIIPCCLTQHTRTLNFSRQDKHPSGDLTCDLPSPTRHTPLISWIEELHVSSVIPLSHCRFLIEGGEFGQLLAVE